MLKNNKGVSLITLIITIVVIIIIAGVSFYSAEKTPESTTFYKYTEEIADIRTALALYRANCLTKYDDENYGFKYVTLANAPDTFVSCSDDASEVTGYVVDFGLLDYIPQSRGKGIVNSEQVKFEEDDVFVYDKNGAVYYAEGFSHNDRLYFNAKTYR